MFARLRTRRADRPHRVTGGGEDAGRVAGAEATRAIDHDRTVDVDVVEPVEHAGQGDVDGTGDRAVCHFGRIAHVDDNSVDPLGELLGKRCRGEPRGVTVMVADWVAVRAMLPQARDNIAGNALLGPWCDRAEGMAAAEGNRGDADKALSRAVRTFDDLGVVFEAARTREELARLRRPSDARALLASSTRRLREGRCRAVGGAGAFGLEPVCEHA
jgi:hypothetical protein